MTDPIVQKIVEKMYGTDDEPPISVEALADWLVDNGLAEDRRGYGHATGEEVAEKLLDVFTITRKENA